MILRFKLLNKKRGQVFIMATLLMVVYTVSMIAVVTELSVERYHQDEINLNNTMNEYIEEMGFQMERGLFKFISNATANEDSILVDLETFHRTFTDYAISKGVQSTLLLKSDEIEIIALKNNTIQTGISLAGNYDETIYISVNTSVVFQSVNSASTLSGIVVHYYGINAFIDSTIQTVLTFKEIDRFGATIKYISGVTFNSPLTPSDSGNGDYIFNPDYDGEILFATLPSGIDFLSI